MAWSPTLGGLPVESDVVAVLARLVGDVEELGWSVTEDEPDFSGADECFITLRAFMFANSLGAALGDRVSHLKATVQDEIERGRAQSATEVADAYAVANRLWQRAHDFFADYDLMIGPVTQVSPFPADQEWPSEVAGEAPATYLHWMLSNCRISAMMLPALSLPAGFTDAGLPVGAQLIGPPLGDLGVLRAAKALEETTGHGSPPTGPGTRLSAIGLTCVRAGGRARTRGTPNGQLSDSEELGESVLRATIASMDARLGGKPPVAIGPHRSMATAIRHLPWRTMAAR